MTADRLTATAVATELDVLDAGERRILGDRVATVGFTNGAVKTLAPREMETVAAYLFALLARAPVKAAPAYEPHRIVLGALATELRGFAAAAGEPVGDLADLRSASSQAEERRIRARLADHQAAFSRHVDDVIDSHHAQQGATHQGEPLTDDHSAAPTTEDPDLAAWT